MPMQLGLFGENNWFSRLPSKYILTIITFLLYTVFVLREETQWMIRVRFAQNQYRRHSDE